MKRCPECRRDYHDDSLMYCLDDGSALLEGPAQSESPGSGAALSSDGEPATAILSGTRFSKESKTTTFDRGSPSRTLGVTRRRKSIVVSLISIVLVTALAVGGFWLY